MVSFALGTVQEGSLALGTIFGRGRDTANIRPTLQLRGSLTVSQALGPGDSPKNTEAGRCGA